MYDTANILNSSAVFDVASFLLKFRNANKSNINESVTYLTYL